MNDQQFYNGVAIAVAVTLVASFGVGYLGAAIAAPSHPSAGTGGPSAAGGPTYVYLVIDGNPDIVPPTADQYEPANFTVPAHTLLVFVVTNYDTGENPVAPTYAKVSGTVGGVEYLNGSSHGVASVPAAEVAHTFSFVSGPYAGFNVAMPAASGSAPSVVTFEAYFNTTGAFVWHCMAPCDSWSMETPGYMTGTMTVEA